jgi:hypothetical protein
MINQRVPMRFRILTIFCSWVLLVAGTAQVFGQGETDIEERVKLGQTTMQFLSVSVHPQAAATGDAVTARAMGSGSMFYNPAGMASMEEDVHLSLAQNNWISDIGYNQGAIAFQPGNGSYGVLGVTVMAVDYGAIDEVIRANNQKGFLKIGTYSPSAMAAGVGYARRLSDRFSVGGHVKYAKQALGESTIRVEGDPISGDATFNRRDNTETVLAADFGVIYRTGFRSLNFAMSVRNFSRELTYVEESVELPLNFQVGLSMDMVDVMPLNQNVHSFLVSIDASHPRSYSERISVGGEYVFMNTVALRAGYISPADEQGINVGVGLQQNIGDVGFGFDYGYSAYGVFGNVHRLAIQLGL